MSYQLTSAKEAVIRLENERLKRALESSSNEFQHVLQLVTLLLNSNDPLLPGYIIDAHCGIANFTPSEYQEHYLNVSLNIQYSELKSFHDVSNSTYANRAVIEGVYAMGSTASMTQNRESDLDIWLCYRKDLNFNQRDRLLQKSLAIQKWAASFSIELNFFLMDQDRFRRFDSSDALTTENCGTTQYMLLLDEFYRSVIRLAGKPLLWLHLPISSEQQYDAVVQRLLDKGKINSEDWVDFGGFGSFSASEYYGATLWHLYKAIDSPYKSAIKLMLLESYRSEYPDVHLIAKSFKEDLLIGLPVTHNYDPYLAMLQKVTSYLESIGDHQRLDLLRCCFYIKTSIDTQQYHQETDWRQKALQDLTKEWGWEHKKIAELDNYSSWDLRRIKIFHDELTALLMQSYRNLADFAHRHKLNAQISPEDISILMRKLYTAFEVLPGKVSLFNRQLSRSLAEKRLMFIEVENSKIMRSGWYLINHRGSVEDMQHSHFVEYSPTLIKLIGWAYFNGILTAKSEIFIQSRNVTQVKLQRFITDLRLSFPINVDPPTNDDLHHPCELRNLFVMVNLTRDPTANIRGKERNHVLPSNLFNFGPEQQSLVGSIDIIYRNLWNEIRTMHFEGDDAILLMLKNLSHKLYRGSAPLRSVQVYYYGRYFKSEILESTHDLVNKCVNVQVGSILNKRSINRLNIAGKTWNFTYATRGVNIQEVSDENTVKDAEKSEKTVNKGGDSKFKFLQSQQSRGEKLHAKIGEFASEGFVQFFFEDNSDGTFNVYILDEFNNPESYYHCEDSKESKVKEIMKLYTTSVQKNDNYFNFPQFYQIVRLENGRKKIRSFRSE